MKESEVKKGMVEMMRKEGGYARRIEDRFTVGMPDTVFIPKGLPVVWVEVKIVDWSLLRPSARQYIELKRLDIPPHSRSLIIGWKAGILYAHPPIPGVPIHKCVQQDMPNGESLTDFFRRAINMEVSNATV